ncbi:MAG: TetR/AcrR family transcriptional regulator [Clostridia bacterium]|nr:TetR/AcrR family transcriptional regulator [Clostridia bacterium]
MDSRDIKDYVTRSLFLLLENNDYDKISMEMIANKSGVSRRTIYRNFKNKEDILDCYMNDMVEKYYEAVKTKIENSANVIARSFQFISDNIKFFQFVYNNKLYSKISAVLENIIRKMIISNKSKKIKSIKSGDSEYYIAFIVGGCERMLLEWLKSQNPKSAKQMTTIYRHIISDLDNRFTKGEGSGLV